MPITVILMPATTWTPRSERGPMPPPRCPPAAAQQGVEAEPEGGKTDDGVEQPRGEGG